MAASAASGRAAGRCGRDPVRSEIDDHDRQRRRERDHDPQFRRVAGGSLQEHDATHALTAIPASRTTSAAHERRAGWTSVTIPAPQRAAIAGARALT